MKQENDSTLSSNRYHLSKKDCDAVLKYLHACVELKKNNEESGKNHYSCHQEGLLIAAVISYSRPFKSSESKDFAVPLITVDLLQVFNGVEEHVRLHNRIIELREKAVAHSDWEFHNTKLIESSSEISPVHRKSSVVHLSTEIDLEMFVRIADIMTLYCACRYHKIDINTRRNGSP